MCLIITTWFLETYCTVLISDSKGCYSQVGRFDKWTAQGSTANRSLLNTIHIMIPKQDQSPSLFLKITFLLQNEKVKKLLQKSENNHFFNLSRYDSSHCVCLHLQCKKTEMQANWINVPIMSNRGYGMTLHLPICFSLPFSCVLVHTRASRIYA